jgi:23S rRNA (adenine2503-C2)-methyltransferase
VSDEAPSLGAEQAPGPAVGAGRSPVEPHRDEKPDLRAFPLERLAAVMAHLGEKPYRAKQLYRWLHRRGAASFEEMTDLPRELRERLAERFALRTLALAEEHRSRDGTIKWKWRTVDGRFIESVYLPHVGGDDDEEEGPGNRERRTLCVSSQVGCAVGCTFCMTGTMGLARNLGPGEIADQVHRANRRLVELGEGPAPRPLTNLVFMGMGEPLHNFESLKLALALLLSEDGPNFSHRHVTVSTSGLVPQIARLGAETGVKLAISLNATTDAQRDALMPVNRRYPIAKLLEACRAFPLKQGRRITFEYVLLDGVNDSDEDAERLARLIRGVPAKVNLIAYNDNPGLGFRAPAPERVAAFRDHLLARNVTAVVRKNRGQDIAAACGQLAAEGGPGDPRRARAPAPAAPPTSTGRAPGC